MGVQLKVSNHNFLSLDTYICHLQVNYVHFNGFLIDISYSFVNLWKTLSDFLLKRHSQNKFFISKFVSNWTPGRTIQGVIVLVISFYLILKLPA